MTAERQGGQKVKRFIIALAVLAFSVGFVGAVSASGWGVVVEKQMRFVKGATSDSTTITLEWNADIAEGTLTNEDTTAVLNMASHKLVNWGSTTLAMPFIRLMVYFSGADNAVTSAAGDSVRIIPEFSYGNNVWLPAATQYAIGASPNDVDVVVAAVTEEIGLGASAWRFRIAHYDQSATTSRQCYVRPIVFVEK
jgi:hypothetical protein